ncbi:hypothetical protein ACFVWN_20560 [Nocardiopsis flavescens]|uniref:hypothetical protein n=1 Tax=Nocardiopsis flavescens TaxID=758803 RepID=UPI003667579A
MKRDADGGRDEPDELAQERRAQRAAQVLRAQRLALGYKKRTDFTEARGADYQTVSRVESGKPRGYEKPTLRALDTPYGYDSGSIERLFAGGDPTPLENRGLNIEDTPALTAQLQGSISGTPPCLPNESLEWRPDTNDPEGVIYTMKIVFTPADPTTGSPEDYEKITMPLSKNRTTENVTQALRRAILDVRFT